MLELSALRMALGEWLEARDTEDEEEARERVMSLVNPRILVIIFARLDEIEQRIPLMGQDD